MPPAEKFHERTYSMLKIMFNKMFNRILAGYFDNRSCARGKFATPSFNSLPEQPIKLKFCTQIVFTLIF